MKCNPPKISELEALDSCYADSARKCERELYAVHKALPEAGAPLIGHGGNRNVYDVGKCVLKISRRSDHGFSIRNESVAWDGIKKTSYRDLFVPVFRHSKHYAWALYPKVDEVAGELGNKDSKFHDIAGQVQTELYQRGLDCYDVKATNVGLWRGKPVILDYEFGVTRCQ